MLPLDPIKTHDLDQIALNAEELGLDQAAKAILWAVAAAFAGFVALMMWIAL